MYLEGWDTLAQPVFWRMTFQQLEDESNAVAACRADTARIAIQCFGSRGGSHGKEQ